MRAVDDRGRLHRLVHAFEAHPGAGEARHRPAVEPVVDDLLHACRIEDRHHHVDEVEFRLVRGGGGFGRVVVAHQGEHAAVFRGAGEIGVAENVAGAVDARALAIPDAEHAVVLALAAELRLLRAPERGRRQVLVDAGLEDHIVGDQNLGGAHELLVEPAERRAAIAGDIARGVEAGAPVALFLHQGRADDRLVAGDEHAALGKVVLVVEGDAVGGHRWPRGHHRPAILMAGRSGPPSAAPLADWVNIGSTPHESERSKRQKCWHFNVVRSISFWASKGSEISNARGRRAIWRIAAIRWLLDHPLSRMMTGRGAVPSFRTSNPATAPAAAWRA